jgi:hypothetical protein
MESDFILQGDLRTLWSEFRFKLKSETNCTTSFFALISYANDLYEALVLTLETYRRKRQKINVIFSL